MTVSIVARIKQITHKLDPKAGTNVTITLTAYIHSEDLADLAQLSIDKVDVELDVHVPAPTHREVEDLPIFRPVTRSVE